MNPFNRRECMPSVLWGMPSARKNANKTEDIKPDAEATDEEAPMTPEPVSPKTGKSKKVAQKHIFVSKFQKIRCHNENSCVGCCFKVPKEYKDLPLHEQKLHNYYASFDKEGLPDVDALVAGLKNIHDSTFKSVKYRNAKTI